MSELIRSSNPTENPNPSAALFDRAARIAWFCEPQLATTASMSVAEISKPQYDSVHNWQAGARARHTTQNPLPETHFRLNRPFADDAAFERLTTCVWRDGTTRRLRRLTSSSTARCGQIRNASSSPMTRGFSKPAEKLELQQTSPRNRLPAKVGSIARPTAYPPGYPPDQTFRRQQTARWR
jgi:hypothetical protein